MLKDHCHYCDHALYKMYLKQGLYSHVADSSNYRDSTGNRLCKVCDERLLREGYEIPCPVCEVPIFALNKDRFKEMKMTRDDLKGIPPQPDPYRGAFIKCKHCKNEINLME